tara:strand:- start:513 stop:797 length:285 start_codon:yes stop_codon:yes gene_type:complete
MKLNRQFFERMGSLEAGVIFPDCNIKEELESMSPEDARKTKRKWRKLLRRIAKAENCPDRKRKATFKGSKKWKKHIARRFLSDLGENMLTKETK